MVQYLLKNIAGYLFYQTFELKCFDNKLYYPLEEITRRDRVITNIKLQDIVFYVLMWANNKPST